jgi:hypothetical protein
LDSIGNVFVAGTSSSSWGSPVQAYAGGAISSNAFAAKLNGNGGLIWNTFLGGGSDQGTGIAVDPAGNVYVAGYGFAAWGTPVRPYSAGADAFAAQLTNGGGLIWNTFLGGSVQDVGNAIAVDCGNVYVAGSSLGTWGSPVRAYTAGQDAFAARISNPHTPTIGSINPNQGTQGQTLDNVIITGANFTGATAVSFGDSIIINSFYVSSNSQITVSVTTTPGASGLRDVSVTTPCGSVSLKNGFMAVATLTRHSSSTIAAPQGPVPLPLVSVQSASLSAAKVAPGTPVTVTANIANTGAVNGSTRLTLYVNGQQESTQGVMVSSGSSTPVTFSVSRNEPGTYSVYVGGTYAGSFTVDALADPNLIVIVSGSLIVFALILGVIFITRKRQAH